MCILAKENNNVNVAKNWALLNHNVNSFSIRSLLERTVVESPNDYPC